MSRNVEQKIISRRPPYILLGNYLHSKTLDPVVTGFRVGRRAVIAIHPEALEASPEAQELPPRTLLVGQLTSFSIAHRVIAKELDIQEKSVAAHVKKAKDAFKVEHTGALARTMFDIGYYVVTTADAPLGLDTQEAEVVDCISYGKSFDEIDEIQKQRYGEDFRSSKTIIAGISRHTNWTEVNSIVIRSIVGGDIGNFIPDVPPQAQA